MGFFDLFRKKKIYTNQKELPKTVVKFFFKSKTYIIEEFDLDFKQDIDENSRPSGEIYGGLITISIRMIPDDLLTSWMMNSYEKQNGEIHFYSNTNKIVEGALLQLSFNDGYCISYGQIMNPREGDVLTTLVISPRVIKINKEEFTNRWK